MKRPLIPVILTILLAVVAGTAVFLYVAGVDDRALADQQAARVLVTDEMVERGTTLADARAAGLVREADVAADLAPVGALEAADPTASSLVFLADMPAGQTVLQASVGTAVEDVPAIEVPDSQMAVSVLLEDPAKVGAFLRPGSRVAIFNTFAVPRSGEGEDVIFETRPLLDDVTVLAVGTVTRSGAEEATEEAWQAQLVTVAVTQGQAERLVHATRTGALHFALLGREAAVTTSEGVSDITLFP